MTAAASCPYRGSELRRESCKSCRGVVEIKVFACSEYTACTVSKELPGIHVCDGGGVVLTKPAPRQRRQQVTGALAGYLAETLFQQREIAVRLDDGRTVRGVNDNGQRGR